MKKSQINLKDFFILKWKPLGSCNYNCSYCCQKNKTDLNVKNIMVNANFIKDKIINKIKSNILISISGGEFSLIPIKILLSILDILHSKNIKILYMTTNFSKEVDYYNMIYNWCNKNKILFLLECSFHEEFTTENIFFNKIKKLNFMPCQIQTVVTKNNFFYMNGLRKKQPDVFFEPNIYDNLSDIKFNFNLNEIVRFNLNRENTYFNKNCFQNEISIKENGDVYNNNCKQIKYGNIKGKIILPTFPFYIKCHNKKCNYSHIQLDENN